MATYYISGIWMNGDHISKVVIHKLLPNKIIEHGEHMTRAQVVGLVNGQNSVYTMQWKYDGNHWTLGNAIVGLYPLNGINYIRTHKDATERDNLDNLIPLDSMGF